MQQDGAGTRIKAAGREFLFRGVDRQRAEQAWQSTGSCRKRMEAVCLAFHIEGDGKGGRETTKPHDKNADSPLRHGGRRRKRITFLLGFPFPFLPSSQTKGSRQTHAGANNPLSLSLSRELTSRPA